MSLPQHDQILDATPSHLAVASLDLAGRFADGATLWCWAPGAPQHAQHVAVEFVHPVVVGTRALPAVAVLDEDGMSALRPMVRAGDALLVIARADAPVLATFRRAEAWGLMTMWMGTGPRPESAPVDHVLWASDDVAAHYDGRLVLGYHVLWELTHVCLEHPGLLRARRDACTDEVCITCSDEGRLAEVVTSRDDAATVRTATGLETVNTMMVGPVSPGDLLLVHAGTAITTVDG